MAAMSTADRNKAARIIGRRLYETAVATCHHGDILAAVGAVDDAFEGLPTALPNQLQSVALNLNAVLTEPFKSAASVAQKSVLLAVWAGVKYGYITGGGD